LREEIVQAILDLFVLSEIYGIDLSDACIRKIEEMARNRKNLKLTSPARYKSRVKEDLHVP
jgi:NTP pyrophosphatase (non-canonical NTP hydrolase)